MTQIHFIGGEKGGVGKSLVARLLAQYLIDHERPFLGFDTDGIRERQRVKLWLKSAYSEIDRLHV